ncbi:MAG: hypothetical protein VX833_04955 [Actinomycetota bacterium]|nr:hypothetical protein [Actinomycetota bacterium]
MFERVHSPRIDVYVRIKFLDEDPEAPLLQEATQGGCSQTLAQGTGDTARNEYVFRHGASTYRAGDAKWRVVSDGPRTIGIRKRLTQPEAILHDLTERAMARVSNGLRGRTLF